MTFLLLPIYGKDNFGISESQYGFIMASNAITVILLQMPITLFVRRFKPLNILAFGAGFFALGFVGMIFANSFWTFMASMVVLSLGEIILVPTATTLAANSAPEDMRGRYMSIFGLAWGLADGVGPMFGGFLSDAIAPVATWYGGLVVTFLCLVGFIFLSRRYKGLRLDSPSLPIHLLNQQ
jgi:MFS family permease